MKKTKNKLIATVVYDKKIAQSYFNPGYYEYEQDRIKNLYKTYIEKQTLSASKKEDVTEIIEKFRNFGLDTENKIFRVLTGIRDRNIKYLKLKQNPIKHKNLINIISNPFILLAAYRTIRTKKGAMTPSIPIPKWLFDTLDDEQKEFHMKAFESPDGKP
jgi:hypothetical protein